MTSLARRRKGRGGAARFERIILHIGTEKTGTSALQLYLQRHRRVLSRGGIAYAASPTATSQWQFVAIAHEAPWEDDDFAREFALSDEGARAALRATLAVEVASLARKHAGGTLIVSSEHFHSRLTTAGSVQRVKDFFAPFADRFEVVVYFRRQDRAAISMRSTFVKSGNNVAADTLTRAPADALPLFHYDDLYERWASAFGQDAMRPRLYAEAAARRGGIVADFFEATKLAMPADPDGELVNTSLSREGYLFLREANALLRGVATEDAERERRALAQRVARLFPGKFFPFGAGEARAFAARFAERNERLRQAAFPSRPAPLFGDDFADVPAEADPQEARPADIASAALTLLSDAEARRARSLRRLRRRP